MSLKVYTITLYSYVSTEPDDSDLTVIDSVGTLDEAKKIAQKTAEDIVKEQNEYLVKNGEEPGYNIIKSDGALVVLDAPKDYKGDCHLTDYTSSSYGDRYIIKIHPPKKTLGGTLLSTS